MKIIDCFINVFDGDSSTIPSSDVLCNVITMQQETLTSISGDNKEAETVMVVYVMNPDTGQVTRERLELIIINSYVDEKDKSINVVSNPKRVKQ